MIKKAEKLDISKTIYERDENLNLIPQEREITVEGKNYTIKIIPLLRGELRRIFANVDEEGNTTKDQDAEIIVKCCVDPQYSPNKEDPNWVGLLKPAFNRAIVNVILEASGLRVNVPFKKAYEEKEEALKKN